MEEANQTAALKPAKSSNTKQTANICARFGSERKNLNIVDLRAIIDAGIGRTYETETDVNSGVAVNSSGQRDSECLVLVGEVRRCEIDGGAEGSKAAGEAGETVGERQASEPVVAFSPPVKLLECEGDRKSLESSGGSREVHRTYCETVLRATGSVVGPKLEVMSFRSSVEGIPILRSPVGLDGHPGARSGSRRDKGAAFAVDYRRCRRRERSVVAKCVGIH